MPTCVALIVLFLFIIPSSFQLIPVALLMGDFSITAFEVLFIFSLISIFGLILFYRKLIHASWTFLPHVVLLLALYFFSLIVGSNRHGLHSALGDFRQYMPILLYFPIMLSLDRTEHYPRKIVLTSNLSMIIVPIYVLSIFFFYRDILITYAPKDSRLITDRIIFDNTVFLFFLFLTYHLNLIFGALQSRITNKLISFLLVLFNFIMLAVSQYRNFYVMFLIAILLYLIYCGNIWLKLKQFFLLLTLIFIVGTLVFFSKDYVDPTSGIGKTYSRISQRISSIFDTPSFSTNITTYNEDKTSIITRIETNRKVFNSFFLPNWFFGVSFGGKLPMVYNNEIYLWKFQIDNGYLTILAKFGVLGAFVYVSFLLKILHVLVVSAKNSINIENRILSISFIIGLISILFGSIFCSMFIRSQPSVVAFVILLSLTEYFHRTCSFQVKNEP